MLLQFYKKQRKIKEEKWSRRGKEEEARERKRGTRQEQIEV